MKIGISIPFDFFLKKSKSDAALVLKKNVGTYQDFLPQVKALGISSVELRSLEYSIQKETVKRVAGILWKEGFSISIHTYLPESRNIAACFFLSFLEKTVPYINSFQEDLILVVHSYRGPSFSYKDSLKGSANTIRNTAEYIERKKLPLKIALELNRGKKEDDPSTTYEGLLRLKEMLKKSKAVGFCWDLGHAYSNYLNGVIPLYAPDRFINEVIHTHIHGVDREDKTHNPLSEDNLPIMEFRNQLNNVQYDGIYNLEINLNKLTHVNDAIVAIEKSVSYLKSENNHEIVQEESYEIEKRTKTTANIGPCKSL